MHEFRRWTARTVVLLCSVLGILACYVTFVFDPNEYKPILSRSIKADTGMEVTIAGPLRVSLLPRLTISAGAIALANTPGFAAQSRLSVREAHVGIAFLPLLMQRVVLTELTLHGVTLLLERDKVGRNNWEDVLSSVRSPSVTAGAGRSTRLALASDGQVAIDSAEFRWHDQQAGRTIVLAPLSMQADLQSSRPAGVTVTTRIVPEGQSLSADVTVHSAIDWRESQVSLRSMTMAARLAGPVIPPAYSALNARGDLLIDLTHGRVAATAFHLTGADADLAGKAEWRYSAQAGPRASYAVHAKAGSLPPLLQWLQGNSGLPRGLKLTRLAWDVTLAGSEQEVTLAPASMDLSIEAEAGGAPVQLAVRDAVATVAAWPLRLIDVSHAQIRLAGDDIVPLARTQSWGAALREATAISVTMDMAAAGSNGSWQFTPMQMRFALPGPNWGLQDASGQLSSRVNIRDGFQHVELHDMALVVMGATLNGSATLDGLPNRPRAVGQVQSAPFDLHGILLRSGRPLPDAADSSVLRKVALAGRFEAGAHQLLLQDLDILIDGSHLTGSLVHNEAESPRTRFTLAVDRFDSDRYWQVWSIASDKPEYANPLEALDAWGLRGELTINRLRIGAAEMRKVRVSVSDGTPEVRGARIPAQGAKIPNRVPDTRRYTAKPRIQGHEFPPSPDKDRGQITRGAAAQGPGPRQPEQPEQPEQPLPANADDPEAAGSP